MDRIAVSYSFSRPGVTSISRKSPTVTSMAFSFHAGREQEVDARVRRPAAPLNSAPNSREVSSVRISEDGELAGLGDESPVWCPNFEVLVVVAVDHESGLGSARKPSGLRSGADMHGELDGGRADRADLHHR